MTDNTWRIQTVRPMGAGATQVFAIAPGCPTTPHGTRNCLCRAHRTLSAAQAYIAEQETTDE